MVVLNDLDRFHLVMDAIDRVPKLLTKGAYVKQIARNKLTEHKRYIVEHGEDMPEVEEWKWGYYSRGNAGRTVIPQTESGSSTQGDDDTTKSGR